MTSLKDDDNDSDNDGDDDDKEDGSSTTHFLTALLALRLRRPP